ncbi:MAG: holo-ACP synthase [Candidatus Nitrosotenuis sp.]
MIEKIGVGIDIVDIRHFAKIPYSSRPKFYTKIFHESEIDYCLRFKNSAPHFAAKFAVKEAVQKSIKEKIGMLEIKTTHKNSKPHVLLTKKLPYKFTISLSHDGNVAVAVVISERSS